MFCTRTCLLCLVSVLLPVAIESYLLQCREEGRFSIPSDCGSYVDCVRRNDTGVLEARKGSCGKGGFHPKEKRCISLKKLKGCSHRRARLDLKRHDLSHLCSGGSDFVCADCNTLVHCLDGVAFAQSCSPGDLCQIKEVFGGAVCYPENLPQCSCERSNIFRRDAYDERTFFFCDNYALPTFYKCSEEMVFDLAIEQCVNEHGLPPCTKIGVFADHDDCRNYYTCIQSERGWVQKLFTCPGLTMYSEVNSKCEDPCKWYKGDFECTEEGRFRDKTNCQAFYECIRTDDRFRKTKRLCPSGFFWEQAGNSNTGNCIRKEDSQCDALTITTCDVPPDWCEFKVGAQSTPDLENQPGDYDYVDYVDLKKQNEEADPTADTKNTENAVSIIIKDKNSDAIQKAPPSALITLLSNANKNKNNHAEIGGLLFKDKHSDQYNFKINANKYVLFRGNDKNADDELLDIISNEDSEIKTRIPVEMNIRESDKESADNENKKASIKEKVDSSIKFNIFEQNKNEENTQNGEVYIPIFLEHKGQDKDDKKGENEDPGAIITPENENTEENNEGTENEATTVIMNIDMDNESENLADINESTTDISDSVVDMHDSTYSDFPESSNIEDKFDHVGDVVDTTESIKEIESTSDDSSTSDSEKDTNESKYTHDHGYIIKPSSDNSEHSSSFVFIPNIFSAYGDSLKFESDNDTEESSQLIDSQNSTEISDVTTTNNFDSELATEYFDDSFVVSTTNRNLDYSDDDSVVDDSVVDDSVATTSTNNLLEDNDYDHYTFNTSSNESFSTNTSNTTTVPTIDDQDSTSNSATNDQQSLDEMNESTSDSSTDVVSNADAGIATALDYERSLEEEPHIFTLGDEVPNLNRLLF